MTEEDPDLVLVTGRELYEGDETTVHRPATPDRTVCGLYVPRFVRVAVEDLDDPRECEHCKNGGVAGAADADTLAKRLEEMDADAVEVPWR